MPATSNLPQRADDQLNALLLLQDGKFFLAKVLVTRAVARWASCALTQA